MGIYTNWRVYQAVYRHIWSLARYIISINGDSSRYRYTIVSNNGFNTSITVYECMVRLNNNMFKSLPPYLVISQIHYIHQR